MGRPERANRVGSGVGFSPAVRLRVGARDVGSVHLAGPLFRVRARSPAQDPSFTPNSRPGAGKWRFMRAREQGFPARLTWSHSTASFGQASRPAPAQLFRIRGGDGLLAVHMPGRERGACQVQSAASRRLASSRTGRWCGRRDRVRAWPSRRARAGNFASPVMRFAAARSPGNFASPVMRFAAARPRCFVRPDRPVTPSPGQFTRQNEDIARPRRRHWLPAGVGKRVAGESATAEAPPKASYLRGHRSRVLDVASSRPQSCRAACR